MRKKLVGKEYGRRQYVGSARVTEKLMNEEFVVRNSEFKKPYLTDSRGKLPTYAQMEYGWTPTHWDGFRGRGFDYGVYSGGFSGGFSGGGVGRRVNGKFVPISGGGGSGGFDMPSNFDALRRKGKGYPGLRSMTYRWLGCEGVTIDYTTLNMLDNETQELAIKDGQSYTTYSWEVSGSGSVSTSLQTTDSDGYASPIIFTPANLGSNHTVTIKLLNIAEVCDEITITVRCNAGSWVQTSANDYYADTSACIQSYGSTMICEPYGAEGTGPYYTKEYWRCWRHEGCVTGLSGTYCNTPSHPGCPTYDPPDYDWVKQLEILTIKNFEWVCP